MDGDEGKEVIVAFALALVMALGTQAVPPQQTPTPTPTPAPTPKPAPTITGKWTITLVTDAFTSTPSIEFVQDGEKITGAYESARYGKTALTGTLKARALEFSFTLSAEGTELPMAYHGEVAADFESIKGTAELTGLGSATWTATRVKK